MTLVGTPHGPFGGGEEESLSLPRGLILLYMYYYYCMGTGLQQGQSIVSRLADRAGGAL